MSSLQQADVAFLARLSLRESAVGLVTDCTNCGGTVPITICRSDANGNSGKPMARHQSCSFFRWFPQLLSHPNIMALLPSSSRSPSLTSSQPVPSALTSGTSAAPATQFPSTQPLASTGNGKKSRKRGIKCNGAFCQRASALRCLHAKCLTHCIEEAGGCPVHLTETDNQQQHPIAQQEWNWDYDQEDTLTLPAEDTLALPTEPYWHDDAVQTNDGLRALQRALQSVSAGRPAVFPSFHDILLAPAPSQPPAPTPQPPAPTTQPPAPTTQPPAPTTQPPAPTTQPPAPSQRSHLFPHAFPVHKLSKPPRVTDQLDPMWTGDLNARAREEIESKRVSECRKEMERASRQRFVLYWFDADNTPVSMQWAVHCPYFPQYQLSDDPALVNSLGRNIEKIDVFEESFMRWIPSTLAHPFTLDSGCHIFIRRHGVTECSGFDDLFKSSKLLTRPSHMRFNMKGERDSIRRKMKQRQTSTPASSSDVEIFDDDTPLTPELKKTKRRQASIAASSSDVEILDNETQLTPKVSLGKRRWAQSPGQEQDMHTATRVRLARDGFDTCSMSPTPPLFPSQPPEDDFDSRRATSMSPTPLLATSSFPSMSASVAVEDICRPAPPLETHQSAQASPSVHVPIVIPVHVPVYDRGKPRRVWPQGMYTVDMVVGFQQMDIPKFRHYGQELLFRLIFGDTPFVKATYHENRKAWRETPLSILEAHKQSGRTQDGLWSNCLAARCIALGLESKKHSRRK
ncbi:hypothetical protein BD769DRAFT_1671653 [Suillus cothurnatus]|nr:hypothetical protein BD769DRAFT_1671653 [Suillus cothurnatus]